MVDQQQKILNQLAAGFFEVTLHTRIRMAERTVSDFDIMECGHTGKISLQFDGKFKVQGLDLDGDDLTVICVDTGGVLIITLF